MGYRTITVDGVDYQYTIGKSFLKFRGGKAVPKSEIGYEYDFEKYMITPASIIEYLRNGKIHHDPRKCVCRDCTNMVTRMSVWPFEAEIEDRLIYAFVCDDCLQRNGEDI